MKRTIFLAAVLLCNAAAAQTVISTKNTSLVIDAQEGQIPQILYYGTRLSSGDAAALRSAGFGASAAYPVHNDASTSLEALSVRMPDGNLSTDQRVKSVSTESWAGGKLVRVDCADANYPLAVSIFYKSYEAEDVISTWTEIRNGEKKKSVVLTRFDSGCLPIRQGDVWVTSFGGSWAGEVTVNCQPLKTGVRSVFNKDGVRNTQTSHAEVMISLDGKPQELSGRVIGAALCYSGNYELRFETGDTRYSSIHRFFAGIDPSNSNYTLAKGETFTTPELAYSFSAEGMSGVSRNFHKWGRKYKLMHGDKERKILLNSWEGVYFDINQQGMDQMMKDIASMGGELFVMDDGWFGDKYPRKTDNSSLGDWVVDKNKLPEGIEGLLRDAKKNGVKFGIWIEPEMANTTSELYEKHPDWIIKAPKRDAVLGRGGTQVVLDLSNPTVQDFVFSVVDNLMTKYPEIDYIKWDANMAIMNHGSQYLTMNDQSHLYIEYHRGFEKTCQRIREKYPDVTIQACASGGGRANWGVLPWFDEFWVSDNTDALQRIYMQWGTSYFFPAIAMASHISATPNHTVFRTTALKYRIDVAMSGRLGMEIQPKNMTDDEKALCRKAIGEYKQIRPIVQFGNIYRLVSPYDRKGLASLMYVNDEQSKAVWYWWKTESFQNEHLPRVRMAGLNPTRMYKVHELNRIDLKPLDCEGKSYSGAYLMSHGLDVPYRNEPEWNKKSDWASRVLYLEAE